MKTPPNLMTLGIHGGPIERLTDELVASHRKLGSLKPHETPSFLDALGSDARADMQIALVDTVPELVASVKNRIKEEAGIVPITGFNAARKDDEGRYKGGSAGDPRSAFNYLTRDAEVAHAFQEFLDKHPTMSYVGYNSLAGSGLAISETVREFLPDTPVAEFGVIPQIGERTSALNRGAALDFAREKRKDLADDHTLFRLDNDFLAALAENRSHRTTDEEKLSKIQQQLWSAINSNSLEGLAKGLQRVQSFSDARPSNGNWLWRRLSLPIRVILSNPPKARVYKASEAFTDVRDFVRLFGGKEWVPAYAPGFVDVEKLTPWLLHPIATRMEPESAVLVTAGYSKEDVASIQRTLERTGIETVTPLEISGPHVDRGEIWVYIAIDQNPYLEMKKELMSRQTQAQMEVSK